MPTETGVVLKSQSRRAMVKTIRSEACHECSAKGACTMMGGGKVSVVEVENRIGAGVGDRVVIEMSDAAFLSGSFLVFFVPALALVAGVMLGSYLAPALGWGRDLSALGVGLALFAVVTAVMVVFGNRYAAGNPDFMPRIVSVIGRAADGGDIEGSDTCHL